MSYFNADQESAMADMARRRCKATQQAINDAFNHLCAALPEGWEIRFVARNDEAEMELYDPSGDEVSADWDGDSHDIGYFLEHAIREDRRQRT